MKKIFSLLLLIPLFACAEMQGPAFDPQAAIEQGLRDIAILNRTLVKVNGKTISLFDVMKKMNAFLYENYPEVLGNKLTMYQYYSSRWRSTLEDMINNELMLLEAETKEITVSEGDVREEVEARFGPNIMASLDEIGMSLEEARQHIETELIVRNVMWMNVHQKAFQETTPKKIKEAYAQYSAENPAKDIWTYQVLSIRGDDPELSKKIADQALSFTELGDLTKACGAVQEVFAEEPSLPKISVSEETTMEVNKLSATHKTALEDLVVGQFSAPIMQKSRVDGAEVWRIFHMIDKRSTAPTPFNEISERIKNQLVQQRSMHYSKIYFDKLRADYHLSDEDLATTIPKDYTPFLLK